MEPDEQMNAPSRAGGYEIMWEQEPSLPDEIKSSWIAGTLVHHLGDIAGNLTGIMQSLNRWSKQKFGAVTRKLEQLRKRLEELGANPQSINGEEINKTRNRMDEVLYREEMMWLQRSCISWMQEGDRNTKYLHWKAMSRAKNNHVKRLRKDDGQITEKPSSQFLGLIMISH
jgi:hypothetical protein